MMTNPIPQAANFIEYYKNLTPCQRPSDMRESKSQCFSPERVFVLALK